MRGATLFSGIGAPECAVPHWDWRFCAEIEKFPAAVHAARFADVPNLGDVTAPDFIERARACGSIDVLVFGSPCQSFSVAGKRLGLDDPRGNLALVALEIARQLRPRWLVFENVPGLLSSEGGRDFGIFLNVMEQCGYLGAWRILDAQFAGVPQRRRRIFFVGHLGDWRPAAAVLFERESLRGDTPPRRKAREGIARAITAGFANAGVMPAVAAIKGAAIGRAPENGPQRGDILTDGTMYCLQTQEHHAVAFNLRGREGGAMPEADEIASMRAADGGSSRSYVAFNWQSGGDCRGLDPQPITMALQREQVPATTNGYVVRRLTPRECERLQGFPDDFTAITYRGKPAADGPRYKALGNSMAVPVIGWILNRIEQFEAIRPQIEARAA